MHSEADLQFIRDHLDADLQRLALDARRYPGLPVQALLVQIAALRKIREKIPSWFDPALEFPTLRAVEQASSETTARFKTTLVQGKNLADLTGGLGIDSFFFAREFGQVTYVEQNPALAAAARANFELKGCQNIRVVAATAEQFLQNEPAAFDVIYLDPDRRDSGERRVFRLEDASPNVVALRDTLLAHAPLVLLKTAPLLDLKSAVHALGKLRGIWVVALRDEVKEVLYLLDRAADQAPENIPVTAVNLASGQNPFTFSWREENAAEPQLAPVGAYLYEPNAAILKAGASRCLALRFGLTKLGRHTHLYSSELPCPDFPGRRFQVTAVCAYDRKALLRLLPSAKANVTARNFPDSVAQIRKKLGLADGGDDYLFAITDARGKKMLILTQKLPVHPA